MREGGRVGVREGVREGGREGGRERKTKEGCGSTSTDQVCGGCTPVSVGARLQRLFKVYTCTTQLY